MNVTRRKILLATGASVGLAGCIGDSSSGTDGNPDDDTDDDGNGNDGTYRADGDDGNDGNDGEDGTDGSENDVFQLGSSPSQPLWAIPDEATGFITLLDDKDDDLWMVRNPDKIDGLRSWLDETDLENSAVVYVETVGPNTCYNEVDINDVAAESTNIVGTAEAVDTSEENEMCGSTITYPSVFVRVTGDDLPSRSTFTVVDGWGESGEVSTDGRYLDPSNLPGHVRPDGDPPKLEELTCDNEEFQRLQGPQNFTLGEVYAEDLTFAMRVHTTQTVASGDSSSPRVGRGDEVRVTMHNVSTDTQETGNRHKWNLQVLTMDGWEDVRGTTGDDPLVYDDLAIEHPPGEGFEWTFEMTEEGIVAGHEHEDKLEVCPDLPSGRYRFLYRGIISGEPLAVEFHYNG